MTLVWVLLMATQAWAQLSTSPAFPTDGGNVTITFNAAKGNKALMNYATTSDVYVHCAVITNLSANGGDWRYNKFTWGVVNAAAKATASGTNLYT